MRKSLGEGNITSLGGSTGLRTRYCCTHETAKRFLEPRLINYIICRCQTANGNMVRLAFSIRLSCQLRFPVTLLPPTGVYHIIFTLRLVLFLRNSLLLPASSRFLSRQRGLDIDEPVQIAHHLVHEEFSILPYPYRFFAHLILPTAVAQLFPHGKRAELLEVSAKDANSIPSAWDDIIFLVVICKVQPDTPRRPVSLNSAWDAESLDGISGGDEPVASYPQLLVREGSAPIKRRWP